jgi:predicted ATPase/serine phosphatase RsbU (regulator of sigma subunit)
MSADAATYTVTATIRETPQGALCRGRRNSDGTPVLLKIVSSGQQDPAYLLRLEHEYSILKDLALPGVARTFGLTKIGDGTALVLEDVGERSLDANLASSRLDLRTFLDTAVEMADILGAIHRHHIIHKDIKPQHFFRKGESGPLTLIDFGVATRLSLEEPRVTAVGRLEGTLAYMSPEQTGRMNRVIDRRTDFYSLGVSAYQLLTGELPFPASDPLELVHSHLARLPVAPDVVVPGLPAVVSAIVMKLLAKNAEERYQDVAGLKADLESCRQLLAETGAIASFPLGREDFSHELRIPQKLYGREAESALLVETLERTRKGAVELLLVSGYSGIGKSALVGEIHKLLSLGGHFVSGKFDQIARSVPYAALSRAGGDLIRAILTEPPQALAGWRQKIVDALGPNGRLMIDLVPELELVIGPQPKAQELGPTESQHRFERTMQEFLFAFASPRHPLVLFLDDLQWADPASLRLLQLLLMDRHRGHLLVVGGYRDNEVGPDHPLRLAIADIRGAGATIHEIGLEALTLVDITQLISDTLGSRSEEILPLARLVLSKTDGNPFFVNQFLTALHKDGLLSFDGGERRWTWDLARIEGSVATDNVVEFVLAKLNRLAPESRRVLRLAACIGHEFDRDTLAVIAEETPGDVAAHLREALREGLVLPLHASEVNARYRFLHDRVQQSAYSLIDPASKREAHLRIGRLLMARGPGAGDDHVFEVVNHMNIGAALIADPEERRAVARLNVAAARKARDAAAHSLATTLLSVGLELLGETAWTADYDLAHTAHLLQAECAFAGGQLEAAFRIVEVIEGRAKSALDRTAARDLKTLMLTSMNRMEEAIACGVETARLLGMDFPGTEEDLGPAIGAELGALGAALAGRTIESLIDLPAMTDPESLALLGALYQIIPAATQLRPQIMVLVVAKAVNLALARGNGPMSSYFYVCYGMVQAVMGDSETGYPLGQLGIKLNEQRKHHAVDGANHFVFAAFVAGWRQHLSECIYHLKLGLKVSLDAGDHIHAGYCASFHSLYRLFRGDSLDDLATELPDFTELLEKTGDVVNLQEIRLIGLLIADLKGRTARPGSLEGLGFDAVEFERQANASGNRFLISSYRLFRAIAAYLAGDLSSAFADITEASSRAVPGNFIAPEALFYRAIILAGRLRAEPGCDRVALLADLDQDEKALRRWAETSPANFGHRHQLVAAELAALAGQAAAAQSLYDQAIAGAEGHGSISHLALANELAAKFHELGGRAKIARAYWVDAHAAYRHWGATLKAREIEAHLPAYAREQGTGDMRVAELDVRAVVKASQAISTEIVLSKLVDSLMRVMIEQTGAQRGYLILRRDGRLWVEGAAGTAAESADFEPFELDWTNERAGEILPLSILVYALRAKEMVLLGDLASQSNFLADRYFENNRPRSLLCLPMLRQGALVGLLYLENSLTDHAFNAERVELLEVLAAQAAISIENATLYDDMERRVEDRTRELEASLRLINENQTQLIEAERKATVAHYEGEMAIARKIQTSILPKRTEVRGLEIAASMVTASEVGGDYYDVLPTADGGCWVGIGDVSGHGLDAGLMMLMIQSGLGALMRRDADANPASLVCHLNTMLHDNVRVRLGRDDFASLTLVRFHPDGRFVFAGAHEDILVWRASSRRVEHIATLGTWVGAMADVERDMKNQEGRLEDGDVMLLYTDGITEAQDADGTQFGIERFATLLENVHAEPATAICARVFAESEAWSPIRLDDQTLVVLRRGRAR